MTGQVVPLLPPPPQSCLASKGFACPLASELPLRLSPAWCVAAGGSGDAHDGTVLLGRPRTSSAHSRMFSALILCARVPGEGAVSILTRRACREEMRDSLPQGSACAFRGRPQPRPKGRARRVPFRSACRRGRCERGWAASHAPSPIGEPPLTPTPGSPRCSPGCSPPSPPPSIPFSQKAPAPNTPPPDGRS